MCYLRRLQKLEKYSHLIWQNVVSVKSTVKTLSNFVAFLENKNFNRITWHRSPCEEMCRNWSKMGNEKVFFRSEHNYTSAPIAQLAACLTFFIWFWPEQTWPERARVQFPGEEHDFFSSFKLIFLSIFCMHLYHILINWSQKFWVVYVQYRFIYEQCDIL